MSRRVRDVIATVVTFLLAATHWHQSYGFYGWHSVYGWLALLPAFVVAIMFSLVGGWTWTRKGRSASQGYFIGLLVFFIVGKFLATWTVACFVAAIPTMVISLFLKPNTDVLERRALNSGMKRCPACAELVRREATKCRFCGEALSIDAAATPGGEHSHAPMTSHRGTPIRENLERSFDAARERLTPFTKSVWTRHRTVVLALGAAVIAVGSWLALRPTTKISTEGQCREAFIQYLILGGGSRETATHDAEFVLGIYRCGSSGTYRGVRTLDQLARGGGALDASETPLQIDLRRRMEEFFLAHYPDGEEQVSARSTGTADADGRAPSPTQDGGVELHGGLAPSLRFVTRSPVVLIVFTAAALMALIAAVFVAARGREPGRGVLSAITRTRSFIVRQRYVFIAAGIVVLVAGTAFVLLQIVSRSSSRLNAPRALARTADMMLPASAYPLASGTADMTQPSSGTSVPPMADASSCDMTGRWDLIFKWRSKRCRDAYNDAERSQTVIINKGSDGKHRSKSGNFLDVTRDPSGRCKIDFARVSEDSYENFVLVEDGSGVTGSANYGDVSKCEREASITATRTALKATDVAFSEEEEEEYAKAFVDAAVSRCSGLPFLQGERGRRFEWELSVSAENRPQRFVVDGADQLIIKKCAAVVDDLEDWVPVRNITGSVVTLRGSSSITEAPLSTAAVGQTPQTPSSTTAPPMPLPSEATPTASSTTPRASADHDLKPVPPTSSPTSAPPAPATPPSPAPTPPTGWSDPFHAP